MINETINLEKQIAKEKQIDEMYRKAFSEKLLDDFNSFCGVRHIAFDEDARMEAYKLGMQAVARYVKSRIDGDLTKEYIDEEI